MEQQTEAEKNDKEVGGSGTIAISEASNARRFRYVPYNYIANLHKGERVLTKEQALRYDGGGTTNNIVINATVRQEADIQKISRELQRQINMKQRGTVLA